MKGNGGLLLNAYLLLCIMFGASIGSFMTVIYYRLINSEGRNKYKIWNPPYSICPVCKKRIPVYDNIPILGYLLLKGKCRFCDSKIPFKYFILEVTFGLSGLVIGYLIYFLYR